ncbi:rhodanese-like domain-containing protein [Maribacter litopenaei]|uniref:rhodanese-like domain-containing protein n=1 Tax=Maribacter litopenaei TaxID=2976127 RepID=UPI0030841C9F
MALKPQLIQETSSFSDKNEYAEAISGKKVQLVDVRTPAEYNGGHIKKAINIDFFNASHFKNAFEKLDKNQPVYVYCRSGARSQKAARKLVGMGFTEIYDLRGGYNSWR